MDPALHAILRLGLALLFGVAAWHKTRDPRRFRETVADYRLVPARLTSVAAGVLVGAEVGVAGLLVALPRGGLPGAAGLLLVYATAIAVNLARGRRELDCGCAGPAARRPIGGWMVARNVVLAAGALAGLAPVGSRPLVWVDGLTIVGGTAVLAALYAAVDGLAARAPALVRLGAET